MVGTAKKRLAALLAAAFVLGAACVAAQGPLPGDVPVTRALQALLGDRPAWAGFLTQTAKLPMAAGAMALAAALAGLRGGPAAMASPLLAYLAAHAADFVVRALVFSPRPDASLVAVASAGAGSGLPSTFALVYGTLFGAVLFTRERQQGPMPFAAAVLAAMLLVAGSAARIVLGGHWPSQVLASLLLAFALAVAAATAAAAGSRAAGYVDAPGSPH